MTPSGYTVTSYPLAFMISFRATSHGRFTMFAVTEPTTFLDGRIVRPVKAAKTPRTSLIEAFSQFTVIRASWDCMPFALEAMAVEYASSFCTGSATGAGAGGAAG